MKYFPQLNSGAVVQFPLMINSWRRSVTNRAKDGFRFVYSDNGCRQRKWHIQYSALTDEEWGSLAQLFAECEGRLATFVFLDPNANLLSCSEQFDAAAWTRGPSLVLAGQVADPFGTNRAARLENTGGALQQLSQTLEIPGRYQYCFSVWVRGASVSGIRLLVQADGSHKETVHFPGPSWVRVMLSAPLESDGSVVGVAVEIPPGASVELFGAQLDAQPFPSSYRQTGGRGGVYAKARFVDDELTLHSRGVGCHDTDIRITANIEE